MSLFVEILTIIVNTIGTVTLACFLTVLVALLVEKLKEIMSKQCKIKCLCKHVYTQNCKFQIGADTIYKFVCRKCGKVTIIKTCEEEE
jgi:hypothetical protein